MKEKFGLLGKTLKHSYSKTIHSLLGEYDYDLYEVEPENLKEFVLSRTLKGYNVTIPYKKDIIPLLDYVDERAKMIGAVNTVIDDGGKLYGYNTDFDGMLYMLSSAGITLKDKKVMILGTGGTSNTAQAVAKSSFAKEIITVSRTGILNYSNYFDRSDVDVLINTTPVGTYPNAYIAPIDLSVFKNLSGVVDVVYNPSKTMLTFQAERLNIPCVSGLAMLVAQAKYAMELFTGRKASDDITAQIVDKISKQNCNVVLVGMPGSGKSTVGRELARILGREFIDTDLEIEKREGCSIPTIFKDKGEQYFRKLESQVVRDVGLTVNKVIATGGGVVKDPENCYPLKCNGKVFWLKREIEKLETCGRPLSTDIERLKNMYNERKDMYGAFSDFTVLNDGELNLTVQGIIDRL